MAAHFLEVNPGEEEEEEKEEEGGGARNNRKVVKEGMGGEE